MSTDPAVPEIPSEYAPVVLTRQEFESLYQRADMMKRVLLRLCASLQTVRQRDRLKPLAYKRLARKLKRQAGNSTN